MNDINTKIPSRRLKNIRNKFSIKQPDINDKKAWLIMWNDYASNSTCPDISILEATWQRLLSSDESFAGIFLFDGNNNMAGFIHYILHPSMWSSRMQCYVEDAYTLPAHRKTGGITVLYDELLARSRKNNWEKLYWMTKVDNLSAQKFYNRIATRTDWVRYERELDIMNE